MRLNTAFLLTLTLGSLPAHGQTPPLINLDVTAVDSNGRPVAGLQAGDFQILDNGKPRSIVWFHPLPAAAQRTELVPPGSASTAGDHSSRGVTPAPSTFILIDLFNADFAARGLTANEVERALEKLETPGDVYLYLLTSTARIFMVHGVTAPEAGPGRGQVPQQSNPQQSEWTHQIKPLLDTALRQVNGLKTSEDHNYPALRIGPTWQALNGLVLQMAEVPGPKSLVWITQGVQNAYMTTAHEITVNTAPLRQFAANLNSIHVAAYTVQQRPSGTMEMTNTGSPGDTLHRISELTGGKAFPTDTTEQAIEEAVAHAVNANYRMAFQPDRLDGKYHKLRVVMARKGIKAQTAQSYYAIAPSNAAKTEEALMTVIGASPFEYSGIRLAAAADGSAGQTRFTIRLQAPDVLFLKQNGRYKAHLMVDVIEYGANGPTPVGPSRQADLDLSEQDYAKAMSGGLEIPVQVALDAATRRVRLAVLDTNTNQAGTVMVPVTDRK